MVNVRVLRKSRRPLRSFSVIWSEIWSAAFSTSGSNLYGRAYSARMACISVSFSPGIPSTSTMWPFGVGSPLSHPSTRAATFIPLFAPSGRVSKSMQMSYGIFLDCISTQACLPTMCSTPTNGLWLRSTISMISPSRRLAASLRPPLAASDEASFLSLVTAHFTVSPFNAPRVLDALTNTSLSGSPSMITKT